MATSAAALTPTPSNPPSLLTMPAELRVRIYEFIFTGKVLTLGVNKALHPALNLLRACKKIYKETRLVVLRCMMLRILNVVESCNAVPRELREAYLPYVREISLCCADCRDIDPNLDFLSYATSLQCLDLGYVCSTGSYDPENTFKATINQNCGFRPGFVGTFWDHQLLHLATWDCEYFRTGVVSVPPPPGTSWLDELLSNKHRGFALQCTVVAFLGGLWENVERRYGKGTIVASIPLCLAMEANERLRSSLPSTSALSKSWNAKSGAQRMENRPISSHC